MPQTGKLGLRVVRRNGRDYENAYVVPFAVKLCGNIVEGLFNEHGV